MRVYGFSCHRREGIRLTAIVETRLSSNDLIMYDLQRVEHVQHLVATADEIRSAFHHNDSARLK
jgi:hypothetical protein